MAATQTEGATKAAGTTTKAATSGVKYRCIMQQVVADVAAKQPWFKAAFVTQRPAGRGTTNVLAATEADLMAACEICGFCRTSRRRSKRSGTHTVYLSVPPRLGGNCKAWG